MGSQTNYTGFFYTKEDDPFALWRVDNRATSGVTEDFVETADGSEYVESDHNESGDNVFVVKKLAPCYYYYWMHF